jgi:hypothetical protein
MVPVIAHSPFCCSNQKTQSFGLILAPVQFQEVNIPAKGIVVGQSIKEKKP